MCMCVYLCECLSRQEERVPPGAGVTDSCESLVRVLGKELGSYARTARTPGDGHLASPLKNLFVHLFTCLFVMCVGILSAPRRPEKGVRCPGAGVIGSCELPLRMLRTGPGPL